MRGRCAVTRVRAGAPASANRPVGARLAWSLVGLFGLAAASLACDEPAPRPPDFDRGGPDVVLITLDTFRADRLAADRVETPHLDQFSRDAARFAQAYSPIPSTLPSHAAILTGHHPAALGIHDNGVYVLEQEFETLAEQLQARGYATGAFVAAFVLDSQFALDQGFDTYDDEMETPLIQPDIVPPNATGSEKRWYETMASPYQRRGERVTQRALAWLDAAGQQERPAFLWLHYFDAHEPYDAPAPFTTRYDPDYVGAMNGEAPRYLRSMAAHQARGETVPERDRRHMIARYEGELSYLDNQLGNLFEGLRTRGRWDDAWIVVIGDHGESFGEHGLQIWEHNGSIHDEVLRVPFLLRRPNAPDRGREVRDPVATFDLAPTLWEGLGLPGDPTVAGRSLLPLLRGEVLAPRPILLEALRGEQAFARPHSWLGLRTARHKLIVRYDRDGRVRERQLFDLSSDPSERRPMADEARTKALAEQLEEQRKALERGVRAIRPIEDATREALKALGYAEDEAR